MSVFKSIFKEVFNSVSPISGEKDTDRKTAPVPQPVNGSPKYALGLHPSRQMARFLHKLNLQNQVTPEKQSTQQQAPTIASNFRQSGKASNFISRFNELVKKHKKIADEPFRSLTGDQVSDLRQRYHTCLKSERYSDTAIRKATMEATIEFRKANPDVKVKDIKKKLRDISEENGAVPTVDTRGWDRRPTLETDYNANATFTKYFDEMKAEAEADEMEAEASNNVPARQSTNKHSPVLQVAGNNPPIQTRPAPWDYKPLSTEQRTELGKLHKEMNVEHPDDPEFARTRAAVLFTLNHQGASLLDALYEIDAGKAL